MVPVPQQDQNLSRNRHFRAFTGRVEPARSDGYCNTGASEQRRRKAGEQQGARTTAKHAGAAACEGRAKDMQDHRFWEQELSASTSVRLALARIPLRVSSLLRASPPDVRPLSGHVTCDRPHVGPCRLALGRARATRRWPAPTVPIQGQLHWRYVVHRGNFTAIRVEGTARPVRDPKWPTQ